MPNLTGLIKDPAGNTVSGELRVILNSPLIREAATPKSLVLPILKTFTVTDGVVNITLEESETDGTSYNFDFKVLADGVLADESLDPFPFDAQIPNAATVDLTDLIPTGIVNTILDTSSRRIARAIATTPELAALIGGLSPKGDWNNNNQYKYNDLVKYAGKLYIYKSLVPSTGIIPSAISTTWMDITPTSDGSLMLGDSSGYGSSWEASELAPSKSVLYGVLEQKATLANPTFTGNVVVPTLITSDTSTKAANAAFVNNRLALYATLASPTFTGTVTVQNLTASGTVTIPTPAAASNDAIATTTAWVRNLLLNNPELGGAPTAPTAPDGTNNLQIATTAFVCGGTWQYITSFANNWANSIDSSNDPLRYRRTADNMILVRGSLVRSSMPIVGSTIFTLPEGFRPAKSERAIVIFVTNSDDGTARISFDISGDVILRGIHNSISGTQVVLMVIHHYFSIF